MEKIPNIVRQRLAAQQAAGEHPDADQLAAFAEQRLSESERSDVLGHLAACQDCREVMALAAPEVTASATASMVSGARSKWWTMPAFQWGAAAAAMAAIAMGLFVLQQPQVRESTRPSQVATVREQKQSSAVQPRNEPNANVVKPTEEREADKAALSNLKAERGPKVGYLSTRKDTGRAAGRIVSESRATDLRDEQRKTGELSADKKDQFAYSAKDADLAAAAKIEARPATAPLSANETVEVTAQAAPVISRTVPEAKAQAANAQTSASASTSPVAAAPPQSTGAPPQSKARATAATAQPAPAAAQNNFEARAADELAVGKASTAVEAQRTKMALAKTQVSKPFRIASGRLQRYDATKNAWDDVSVGTASRLSVVGNLANEVWVGGTDGTMFYSNDMGAHWISTSTGGWSKDAAFTGLTPTARQSVEVYLSNGERWRSADGGASWTRYQ